MISVAAAIVRWELGVLGAVGYGIDIGSCAVTGETDDLAYVSPRSGRAVSRSAAGDYANRLLVLPQFLTNADGPREVDDVAAGFALTGYFLDRRVLVPHQLRLPPARERFMAHIRRLGDAKSTTSGRE